MRDIFDVFNNSNLHIDTRCFLIIELGRLVNLEYGSNITEPIVYELIRKLKPDHYILKNEFYIKKYEESKYKAI